MEFTQRQQEEYVLQDQCHCPYCGSDDIASGDKDYIGNELDVTITCHACNKSWIETYVFKKIVA
jgi:transcription elongation factor Elf1